MKQVPLNGNIANGASFFRPRDYCCTILIAIAVTGFHVFNGYPLAHSVLLQSFNWAFDFDSSRFVGGWCTPGIDASKDLGISFVARHALSLAIRPLCLGLNLMVADPNLALMGLTALCAGGAAAIAYVLSAHFCTRTIDRSILALGFATMAQPMFLGVLPETFGFALAGIGLHLIAVARDAGSTPSRGPLAVASLVLNAGVTVTNAGLNLISSSVLAWRRTGLRKWLAAELKTWLWAAIVLLLIVVPLAAWFAPRLISNASTAPKAVWWIININRGEAADLARVVITLVLYGLVAPSFTTVFLPAPDLHDMLDFRAMRYSAIGAMAITLWVMALIHAVRLSLRDSASRRMIAIIGLWLLFNVLLHWFWQSRGSVFLYGAHTAFPIFAILAIGYGRAIDTYRPAVVRSIVTAIVLLTAFNNFGLYRGLIDFLARQQV